jgi:hypothetical protein
LINREDAPTVVGSVQKWLASIEFEIENALCQRRMLDLRVQFLYRHQEHLLDALIDLQEGGDGNQLQRLDK